jgi:hypothetical protein
VKRKWQITDSEGITMASAAQIEANRLNARKSTGPRTPEGKAKAAQNAIKHGLFAREGVIRGEDREEFEVHREMLLEQLNPAGPLEGILAARIVDLTWRLRRAAQDQNEAFGALYDRHTAGTPEPQEPEERGATLGRMILVDFSQGAVLERLLRYERRIEGSLYRTLNELRRVHDQGQKADQEVADTLGRWREEDWEARKARAFAFRPPPDASPGPAGGTTNAPMAQVTQPPDIPSLHYSSPASDSPPKDETCETNPISEVVSSWKCEVSRESCATESRGGPTGLGHAERSEASGLRIRETPLSMARSFGSASG